MTKPATSRRSATPAFRCTECGATALRWIGRCGECQSWGTVAELGAEVTARASRRSQPRQQAQPIGELDPLTARARTTGVDELDRVLGGGIVPGSVVLLAGEPGVGKSTLLLKVAHSYAATSKTPALIVTGEESPAQVRLRAERINAVHPGLFLAAENDLGALLSHVDAVEPGLLVVDSVQTIGTEAVDSAAGGVPQIRAVTAALIALAKERGIATVIVGHVTKDGSIAGPRVLEHLVDVVLHFEGDRHSALRLIRATKNRFGAADEVGCFEMREDGIAGLADPSGLFLSDRAQAVSGTCVTVTVEGRRPMVTEVQALVTRAYGNPRRAVTNLDSGRVGMAVAILTSHGKIPLSDKDVFASTVGGLAATEPGSDLAVALAIASAAHDWAMPSTLCAIGEVSLSGDIRRVMGLDKRLAEAARLGFTTVLVPPDQAPATSARNSSGVTSLPAGRQGTMRIVPVATIGEALAAVESLRGRSEQKRRTASLSG